MRKGEAGRNKDGVKLRHTLSFHSTVRQTLYKLFILFIVTENTIKIFPVYQNGKPQEEINWLPNNLKLTKSTLKTQDI